jgi:RimJ/RimL family protein N-acetyltransferase
MSVVIRDVKLEDAKQLIAHTIAIADEPGSEILLWPGEFLMVPQQERKWINAHLEADNSAVLVAEVALAHASGWYAWETNPKRERGQGDKPGHKIVGVLSCNGGQHRGNHHTTTLGITIHKDWRNQGIGHALMKRAIAWAKETGVVKRMQLEVTSTNAPAIHLYEKVGFEKEGLHRRGMFKNGRYYDTWVMGLLLD